MFPLILRLLSVCCTFPGPGRARLNSVRIQLVIEICLLFIMSVRVLSITCCLSAILVFHCIVKEIWIFLDNLRTPCFVEYARLLCTSGGAASALALQDFLVPTGKENIVLWKKSLEPLPPPTSWKQKNVLKWSPHHWSIIWYLPEVSAGWARVTKCLSLFEGNVWVRGVCLPTPPTPSSHHQWSVCWFSP